MIQLRRRIGQCKKRQKKLAVRSPVVLMLHSADLCFGVRFEGKGAFLKCYAILDALSVNMDQCPDPVEVGDFLFWFVWALFSCSLTKISDRGSLIAKCGFVFSLQLFTEAERSRLCRHDQKLTTLGASLRASLRENDIKSSIRSLGVRSRCRSKKWSTRNLTMLQKYEATKCISVNESLIGCVPSMRLADCLCQ